ncbi:MAG: hypothetical protein K2X94_04550 [Amoebophilaceae bacterium]|nr:hypothetical protein [Amoebophilaceae bacterium]
MKRIISTLCTFIMRACCIFYWIFFFSSVSVASAAAASSAVSVSAAAWALLLRKLWLCYWMLKTVSYLRDPYSPVLEMNP